MKPYVPVQWSVARLGELRRLREVEGMSTLRIGKAMGLSGSAVEHQCEVQGYRKPPAPPVPPRPVTPEPSAATGRRAQHTDASDEQMQRMALDGAFTGKIAAALGIAPHQVRRRVERLRQLGRWIDPVAPAARAEPRQSETPCREGSAALPAGHPASWSAITAGTMLADMPWPGDDCA